MSFADRWKLCHRASVWRDVLIGPTSTKGRDGALAIRDIPLAPTQAGLRPSRYFVEKYSATLLAGSRGLTAAR